MESTLAHCLFRVGYGFHFFFFGSGGQVVTGAAEEVRPLLEDVGISPDRTYPAYLICPGESGLTGVTAGTQRRQSQE